MQEKQVDWKRLKGHTFQTTTGTRFTVVNVTAKNVIIRPEGGKRNYDLSIQKELEHAYAAYIAGRFFPSPTELLRVGVRAVRTSYAWGILHALLVNEPTALEPVPRSPQRLAGEWRIMELSDMVEDYFAESAEPPHLSIGTMGHERVYGNYHFGLADGHLDGAVRQFGGETVLLFGYEGSDEMDRVNGAGWARLKESDRLEGEFLGYYGKFVAERERDSRNWLSSHQPKRKR